MRKSANYLGWNRLLLLPLSNTQTHIHPLTPHTLSYTPTHTLSLLSSHTHSLSKKSHTHYLSFSNIHKHPPIRRHWRECDACWFLPSFHPPTNTHTHTCPYTHAPTPIHTYMPIHKHAHMFIHSHSHTHSNTQLPSLFSSFLLFVSSGLTAEWEESWNKNYKKLKTFFLSQVPPKSLLRSFFMKK